MSALSPAPPSALSPAHPASPSALSPAPAPASTGRWLVEAEHPQKFRELPEAAHPAHDQVTGMHGYARGGICVRVRAPGTSRYLTHAIASTRPSLKVDKNEQAES